MTSLDRINQEALILFAVRGFYGTSLSMIANAVGIRKSSIYAHFSSKDELFLSVVQSVADIYETKMENFFTILKQLSQPVEHQLTLVYEFMGRKAGFHKILEKSRAFSTRPSGR